MLLDAGKIQDSWNCTCILTQIMERRKRKIHTFSANALYKHSVNTSCLNVKKQIMQSRKKGYEDLVVVMLTEYSYYNFDMYLNEFKRVVCSTPEVVRLNSKPSTKWYTVRQPSDFEQIIDIMY